ncbi:MAG: CHAT domain-containing protein [Acidobacteriota bacterium]
MRVLRLRHSLTAGGGGLIAVDYDAGHGPSGFSSQVPFLFELNERDRSRLRFYLENFLTCPNPAALDPVADLQSDLRRWGEELFQQVFVGNRRALLHYQEASRDLHTLRIEVHSDPEGWAVPWEILCDPSLGWLAPQVGSFVRVPVVSRDPRELLWEAGRPVPPGEPLRVLYVVGRPAGSLEIPFHSVARSLLYAARDLGDRVRIDFLRPPTFERLAKVLSEAAEEGRPYLALHFDGHGVFTDSPQDFAGEVDPGFVKKGDQLERRTWTRRRGGARGYLLFEDLDEGAETRRLVDGVQIGNLVARTKTPLVVLHACQSATARIETLERLAADPTVPGRCPASPVGEAPDDHDQDLAYRSLASEIMRFHARAVVALPWTLPPFTATRVLKDLYGRVAEGLPVGEAAGRLRSDLAHALRHESLHGMVDVDDWLVPLVYETMPLPVCDPEGSRRAGRGRAVADGPPPLVAELPRPPAWGFVDRPEVLFTLDRAFDVHGTVLLHAFAGAGKTSLAREFALWYRYSGGLLDQEGRILWSSFESYNPLAPFDAFEQVFRDRLKRDGSAWAAASREERKRIALDVLDRVPALWIWDNVELVGGFPPGSEPLWSDEERGFLAEFLTDLARTRCKVLLVGRRPEPEWLGEIPYRIALPPMPMEERGELTIRITGRHGLAVHQLASFGPLLKHSQGNPLTLSFLLTEALREGRRRPDEVRAFLADLRLGEGAAAGAEEADPIDPTSALLGSLLYGYERAFGEEERRQLALLHLFRGFVDLNVLCWMGHPEAPWCLASARDLGRESWTRLLDRAAQAGLLTPRGGDCYGIHPALPFFFRGLFESFWKEGELSETAAARAFTESMAGLGTYYNREYRDGNRDVVAGLLAQEANLLQARALARQNGWWTAAVNAMQGLETLYTHTGRAGEWKRLVRELMPELMDPETEEPLPGREALRDVLNDYAAQLARRE